MYTCLVCVCVSEHDGIDMQWYRTVIVYLALIHKLNVVKITLKEITRRRWTLVYYF